MTPWLLYAVAGALVLGAAALLLLYPVVDRGSRRTSHQESAEFFPVHCRFFPQVRHTFSSEDSQYMAARASRRVLRRWKRERRRAARMYLAGVREDFARLNRLSRLLSLHSPQVRARQEAQLLSLNLRFQVLYGMVVLRTLLGQSAVLELGHISSLIGGLGSRLERAALAPHSPAGALTP